MVQKLLHSNGPFERATQDFSRSDDATITLSSIRDVNKDICASAKRGVADEDAAATAVGVGSLAKGGKRGGKLRLYPCLRYTTRLMRVIICTSGFLGLFKETGR